MNKQTQDGRKSSVQEAIQQAYLDSLQSPGKITAAQLCKKAHVNRSSFYNHFADIADVRETLENELFESVAGELEKGTAFSYDFFLHMIQIIKRNQILVTAVLDNIQNSSFFRNVVSYFRHKYIRGFEKDAPGLEQKEAESLFTYILSGSIGIISDWIRGKEGEPEEEIAGRISRLNGAVLAYALQSGTKNGHTL